MPRLCSWHIRSPANTSGGVPQPPMGRRTATRPAPADRRRIPGRPSGRVGPHGAAEVPGEGRSSRSRGSDIATRPRDVDGATESIVRRFGTQSQSPALSRPTARRPRTLTGPPAAQLRVAGRIAARRRARPGRCSVVPQFHVEHVRPRAGVPRGTSRLQTSGAAGSRFLPAARTTQGRRTATRHSRPSLARPAPRSHRPAPTARHTVSDDRTSSAEPTGSPRRHRPCRPIQGDRRRPLGAPGYPQQTTSGPEICPREPDPPRPRPACAAGSCPPTPHHATTGKGARASSRLRRA
jgi:hypothetical protein